MLKRSESLSPRHEKEWKQLSSRFSSDENIIDIDHLSATHLTASVKVRTPESQSNGTTPITETASNSPAPQPLQQQPQLQHPKELTLSGGGAIFLKSNRVKDTTPCKEETRTAFEELAAASTTTTALSVGKALPGTSSLTISGGGSTDDMTASAGERLKSILREKFSEDG